MVKAEIWSMKLIISYVEMYMACVCEIKLFNVNETTVNTSYLIVQWIPRMKCFQDLHTLPIPSSFEWLKTANHLVI